MFRSLLCVMLLGLTICIPGCVFWTHCGGLGSVVGYVYVSGSPSVPGESGMYIGMDPPDGFVPWAFASVQIAGTRLETTTDAYGRFKLSGVPAGRRTLRVGDGTLQLQHKYDQPASTLVFGSPRPKRSWTVMIYMIADNNLGSGSRSYMAQDLKEMERADFDSAEISVLAFVDPLAAWPHAGDSDYLAPPDYMGARVLEIARDVSGSTVLMSPVVASPRDELGAVETNSVDPEVLRSFVNWCKTFYPAYRYALILWNHGDGIAIHNGPGSGGVQARAIGPDEDGPAGLERRFMDVDQIAHALRDLEVDLIGFDACLMGCVEVVYELRRCAEVVVASEQAVPGPGWDYTDALGILSPEYDAWQYGVELVESYANAYRDYLQHYSGPIRVLTCSAVSTGRIEDLADRVDSLSRALDEALSDPSAVSAVREGLMRALAASTRFGYSHGDPRYQFHYYDLAGLCEEVFGGISSSGWGLSPAQRAKIENGAHEVLQWFDAAVAEAMLYSREIADTGSRPCSGLSVYCAPPDTWSLDNPGYDYGQCEFAQRTRWFEVMSRL